MKKFQIVLATLVSMPSYAQDKNAALKAFYISIIFIFSSLSLYAQDIIVKKDGTEIQAKVFKISLDNIEYKKFDNLDGPIYTIVKSEVFMIKYQNGAKDVFNEVPKKEPDKVQSNIIETKEVTKNKKGRGYMRNNYVFLNRDNDNFSSSVKKDFNIALNFQGVFRGNDKNLNLIFEIYAGTSRYSFSGSSFSSQDRITSSVSAYALGAQYSLWLIGNKEKRTGLRLFSFATAGFYTSTTQTSFNAVRESRAFTDFYYNLVGGIDYMFTKRFGLNLQGSLLSPTGGVSAGITFSFD